MFFTEINLVTVLVATIMGFGFGLVWYAPWAFGKLWKKVNRHENTNKSEASSYKSHVISLLVTFISAFILASLFNSILIISVSGILLVGFLMWLGFTLPVKINEYMYSSTPFSLISIDLGHQLVVT